MTEIYFIKCYGNLLPVSEGDVDIISAIPDGETIKAELKRPRNVQFHKKYFALLDVLFNIFEPVKVEGKEAMKNRERFRKDIAIATGHYELVYNIKSEIRAEARSISFARMSQEEFEALYNRTIDYGLQKIAVGKSREQIENWVSQILEFD